MVENFKEIMSNMYSRDADISIYSTDAITTEPTHTIEQLPSSRFFISVSPSRASVNVVWVCQSCEQMDLSITLSLSGRAQMCRRCWKSRGCAEIHEELHKHESSQQRRVCQLSYYCFCGTDGDNWERASKLKLHNIFMIPYMFLNVILLGVSIYELYFF